MVTTEALVPSPSSPAPPDADALFKEAQRHRRNRRLKRSSVAILALLVVSLIGLMVAGGSDKAPPVIPLSQPAFASTVVEQARAAGGADFTLVVRSPGIGCGSSNQMSVNRGSVDFVNRIIRYSTSIPGCPAIAQPPTIQTLTATYKDVGGNVAPSVPTTASRPWLQTTSHVQEGLFSVADAMLSPALTPLLSAVTGPLAIGRSVTINGVAATEYRGTTTLAVLQRDDPVFARAGRDSFVPSASSITIPIQFWVDGKGRLVRASATEPVYTQAYPRGMDGGQVRSGGAQVSTSSTGNPPVAATTPPRVQGVAHLTLTFTDFGTKVIVLPSPTATATAGS